MSLATSCQAVLQTAVALLPPVSLLTWRCSGCRKIIVRLQYDGRSLLEHKCACNRWSRLPDDVACLRIEEARRA